MNTARMARLFDGTYRCTFPYDPIVVDAIKRIVPAHSRTYDPAAKAWIVAPAYKDIIHQLLEDVFVEVEWDAASVPEGEDAYRALHLLPTAPKEVAEAAYKTLSRMHHPDVGGDHRQMQTINQAIFRIRRQLA